MLPLRNQRDPLSERLRHLLTEFKCCNYVPTKNSIKSYSTARPHRGRSECKIKRNESVCWRMKRPGNNPPDPTGAAARHSNVHTHAEPRDVSRYRQLQKLEKRMEVGGKRRSRRNLGHGNQSQQREGPPDVGRKSLAIPSPADAPVCAARNFN